ncbi:hypothetical protein MRBBS_0814 [Marinobacter sp. BSs20148]|nr:hypothetical protein MRBBS_0814 [Marinobacter sp. BSs20148]
MAPKELHWRQQPDETAAYNRAAAAQTPDILFVCEAGNTAASRAAVLSVVGLF